jgi:hypothetical protein
MKVLSTHVVMVDLTEALLVQVTFEVPGLGEYEISFMGHHVRNLHNELEALMKKYPHLCGEVSKTIERESITFPGYDPGKAPSN